MTRPKTRLTLALAGALFFAPGVRAQSRGASDLHRLKERLEAIRAELGDGRSTDAFVSELLRLRTEERARLERLRDRFKVVEKVLAEKGLGGAAEERLALARAALEESHGRLLEGLEKLVVTPDVAEIEECLRILEPLARATREDVLSAQEELPLRSPALKSPPLVKSGVLDTEALLPLAASAAAAIGPIPGAIQERAAQLDGPVAVYEFVKNTTRFELYYGLMKGAEQTLLEGRGNDADVNALLVAMLRAKGIPARFVRGVVKVPIERVMSLTGVERSDRVEQALAGAALPYEPVFAGGRLSAIEMERIWAEAYVPYSNYRGVGLDDQGKRWVALDASVKSYAVDEGFRVLEAMDFDAEAFVDESFKADGQENPNPLATLRERVTEYLSQNQPGMTYEAALRKLTPVPEVFGALPSSLPYEVLSVNGVFYDFPQNLEHAIRFIARNERGQTILDATFPASLLLGHRLTISYVPATNADRDIVDGFKGLYKTPPYLVDVRPVVRSGGVVIGSGGPIGMGLPFTLSVEFKAPAGTLAFENRLIAGAYAAIALAGRGPTFSEPSETKAGEILSQRALRYLDRWSEADEELSGLARTVTVRPVPSHVMVKNHVRVEYASSGELVPMEFIWKGIDVDADLRPVVPVPAEGDDDAARTFFLLSGLVGSDLESRVLEDDLQTESISTLKLLRRASTLGIEVVSIDGANVDTELPRLTIEAALKERIRTQVHLGRRVEAPVAEVTLKDWTGAGFAAIDPSTGEGAYLLSGVIAGAETTEPPPDPNTRKALNDPDETPTPPSPIPASIQKVPETDFQEALVTKDVDRNLAVWVTDADGNPVADGLPVTFVTLEQGSLVGSVDGSDRGSQVTVPTRGGFAQVRFAVGASTRLVPRFILDRAGDTFATQVGRYSVTARVGDRELAEPFIVFAFPDAEEDAEGRHARLRLVTGRVASNYPLTVSPVLLWTETVDRFGNPLSNIDVTYEVGTPERTVSEPLPAEFTNAALLAEAGEVQIVTEKTGAFGIAGYARLGDVDATHYHIAAKRSDPKLGDFNIDFIRTTYNMGTSTEFRPLTRPLAFFRVGGLPLPSGEILWLGKAGEKLPGEIALDLEIFQESYEVAVNPETEKLDLKGAGRFSTSPPPEGFVEPVLVSGTGSFEPASLANVPDGVYEFQLFFGPEPARRLYGFRGNARFDVPRLEEGEIVQRRVTEGFDYANTYNAYSVWGATVTIKSQGPDPFFLDGNGHLEQSSRVFFEVSPPEVLGKVKARTQGALLTVYRDSEPYRLVDLPSAPSVALNRNLFFDSQNPFTGARDVYEVDAAILPGTDFEIRSEKKRLNIFNAELRRVEPRPVHVRPGEPKPDKPNEPPPLVTATDAVFSYFVEPSAADWNVQTAIIEKNRQTGAETERVRIRGNANQGEGQSVLPAKFEVDLTANEYRAELVLTDRAGGPERRSKPLLNLFGRLLYDVKPLVVLEFDVDPLNELTCFREGFMEYSLQEAAAVQITVVIGDEEQILFRGLQIPDETNRFKVAVSRFDLFPPRSEGYLFRIYAQSIRDPNLVEESAGTLEVRADTNSVLPVGHTFVKGVDLSDGHLVSASTDVTIPGRGPKLEIARTYGSRGADPDSPLGPGWTHNYLSELIVTDCFYTIVGGDGTGQRFTSLGNGVFKPQKGYHTTLVANGDGSFDFFSKAHVRYHYVNLDARQNRFTLTFIEDTHGNRLELTYDGSVDLKQVREVFRGGVAGRALDFFYTNVLGGPRLTKITGPLGLEILYEYDAFANLVEATRGERIERYEYTIGNGKDRHNLVAYVDPNGNRTRYVYFGEDDPFPGEPTLITLDKFEWIKRVEEPEGVTTSFVYDRTKAVSDGLFITRVTDGRANETIYTLNSGGSPLKIEEPLGVTTEMKWAAADVFKEMERDANGRVTTYKYDANANLIEERIETADKGPVVTAYAYELKFNKMTLKRDAEGRETTYDIDSENGNLRSMTDADEKTTLYEYFPNGDLRLVTDPRDGKMRFLDYDDFGNPETIVDPEDNETRKTYDVRSRLRSVTDTMGHETSQDYDALDRVTLTRRTDAKGSSKEEVVTREYYPAGQAKEETNGLSLVTTQVLDGLNRVKLTRQVGQGIDLTTQVKYDRNGNAIEARDRRGVLSLRTYDALNRLVKAEVRGPFGATQVVSEMDYDQVGNKLFETDVHNHRADFEYDGLYRVKTKKLATSDGTGKRHEQTFVYDKVGNKLEERDANGKLTTYTYDVLNRLKSRTDAVSNVMEYDYDASGNRTFENDVTRGLVTETEHDFLNRPKQRTVSSQADGFSYLTLWDYDDSNHTIVETDPRGFKKTAVLDGFDRVHEVRQELESGGTEAVTTTFYDANGNPERSEDAEGRETSYRYDALNRLKRVDYALAPLAMTYEYDGEGQKTEETNRRGVVTRYSYDNLGRTTETRVEPHAQMSGQGAVTRVSYDDPKAQRLETDPRNLTTLYEMDGQERVVKITDPLKKTQDLVYDGVNKVKEIDKRANPTELKYDGINRIVEVKDALGQVATTQYLDSEKRVVEKDKRDLVKTTALDALGRTVSVTRSNVLLEQHAYDGMSNRTLSVDANENKTRFEYDGANRVTARTQGFESLDATRTEFKLDKVGNMLEEKDGRVTGKPFDVQSTYDELNRLETVEDGEANVTSYEYDGEGNRTAQVEPEKNRTEYVYGELNELLEVKGADQGVFTYRYDPNRNRIEQVDAENRVVRMEYDELNRMTKLRQAPAGFNFTTVHEYDPNGNETKLEDAKGQVTTYEYDELNRLKAKVYALPASESQLFTRTHRIDYVEYDENDNLKRIDETRSSGTDPPAAFTSTMRYDALDRLDFEFDSFGRKLDYAYDKQGNRTSLTDPDNKLTSYTYDALNRLKTVTTDPGTADERTTTYAYFPDDLKRLVTQPNGTTSEFTYDAADRVKTITHKAGESLVSAYSYSYDSNGNRLGQVETNAGRTDTTTYTYDKVNRLETVTYPGTKVVYTYDKAGNRKTEVETDKTTTAELKSLTYAYDTVNRLMTITDNRDASESVTYGYDANGNTTSKTKAGVETRFLFDIRNQLGEVQQGASVLGRYGYDYEGRRILKIGADGVRRYSYDEDAVITEADANGATVVKYEYGLDQLLSLRDRNDGRSFYHLDALRSTVNLTTDVGATREALFYDAWGRERDRLGSSTNHFTFTGHEVDRETGLFYAKARFYDPDIGRFLSQDTLLGSVGDPPSLHRYFYAYANPTRYIDPTGHQSLGEAAEAERKKRQQQGASSVAVYTNQGSGTGNRQRYGNDAMYASELGLSPDDIVAEQHASAEHKHQVVIEDGVTSAVGGATSEPAVQPSDEVFALAVGIKQGKRDALKSAAQIAQAAKALSEAGLEIGFDKANNVVILATGKTLTGHEADRYLAALALGTPVAVMVAGKVLNVIRKGERVEEAAQDVLSAERRLETAEREAATAARRADRAEDALETGGRAVAPAKRSSGQTVLGKYPYYVDFADEANARRMGVPTDKWNRMTDAERWTANEKFLDRTITRGDEILLVPPVQPRNPPTGTFEKEIDYMRKRGFEISEDGTRLVRK